MLYGADNTMIRQYFSCTIYLVFYKCGNMGPTDTLPLTFSLFLHRYIALLWGCLCILLSCSLSSNVPTKIHKSLLPS